MNNDNQSFFDSKTLMAIVLSVGVFMAWNSWIQKKYPNMNKKPKVEKVANANKGITETTSNIEKNSANNKTKSIELNTTESTKSSPEKTIAYSTETLTFDLSSKGMGLKTINLNKYTDDKGNILRLGYETDHLNFETNFIGNRQPLNFKITQQSENSFVGTAKYKGMSIKKIIEVIPSTYSVNTTVILEGVNDSYLGLVNYYSDKIVGQESGGLLSADRFNIQSFYSLNPNDEERETINPLIKEEGELIEYEDVVFNYSNTELSAVGAQYFTLAHFNKSDIVPNVEFSAKASTGVALAQVKYPVLNNNSDLKISYINYLGPKSLSLLKSIDEKMIGVVDLGFFGAISQVLFQTLKVFFDLTNNWGVAIILLTILVKILLLPLTLASMKSMKNMQKINPLMKDLKEKYKDDKQQLNLAMMNLYKEHKVNPVGGCLPMLLQIPIYFALYQALGQVVELYHTPFILWITDLSAKDPYYVLPVLMGIGMYVQQKITPPPMDSNQAKMMQYMPVVFSLMMMSLPSGLTLYITVNTVFTVVQQYIILKKDSGTEKKTKTITVKS